jgi:hypothetical protein
VDAGKGSGQRAGDIDAMSVEEHLARRRKQRVA